MRAVRSWSPMRKVTVAIVAFYTASFLWALLISDRAPKLELIRKWRGHDTGFSSLAFPPVFVAFFPDGHLLASWSIESTLKLWRVSDGKLLQALKHEGGICSVAFSPNGRLLALGGAGSIKLWRMKDGKLLQTRKHDGYRFKCFPSDRLLAFSSDGHLLASGCADGIVRLWRVDDGQLLQMLKHKDRVNSVAFSSDGHLLASGSFDSTVKLWRVDDGKLLRTLKHGDAVLSIAFSPDGRLLSSGGMDCTIKLWRVSDGELLQTLKHDSWVRSVAFSPDGHYLASAGGIIKLWRVSDGKAVWEWKAGTTSLHWLVTRLGTFLRHFGISLPPLLRPCWLIPHCVAFSSDGQLLAAGISSGSDGMIYLWRVRK